MCIYAFRGEGGTEVVEIRRVYHHVKSEGIPKYICIYKNRRVNSPVVL